METRISLLDCDGNFLFVCDSNMNFSYLTVTMAKLIWQWWVHGCNKNKTFYLFASDMNKALKFQNDLIDNINAKGWLMSTAQI